MQFEHINISAPLALLEKVKDFYIQVLSLEQGFRPNFSDAGFWLYYGKQPIIHLSQSEGAQGGNHTGFIDHLAFRLTGINTFTCKLSDLNIEYHIKPVPQLNMQQVFLYDPAGIKLEINFVNEPPLKPMHKR